MFQLHPTLAKDTFLVGDFPLSTVRLMNDCQFPWLILVPRVSGIKEIYELSAADQVQFLRESSWVSSQMAKIFGADKMNVAALAIRYHSYIFITSYATKMMPHGQIQFGVMKRCHIPKRYSATCSKR